MAGPNITLIGAGSITFAMNMVRDIIATDALADTTVTLMDVDAERLSTVLALAQRLARERDANIHFRQTLNREEALQGADFVLNSAAPGERERWLPSRDLARKHGYMCAKTYGPRGMANTQLALDVARDVERICPNAWLIQLANPMTINIWAITRYTKAKVIGLCHGIPGTVNNLVRWMNLDPAQLEAQAIGLNHFVFFTTLRYQGKDAYPLLAEFLEQRMPEIWETDQWKSRLDIDGPATREMFRIFGLYPCNGDAHMSEFVPWFTTDEHDANTFKMKMDYADRYIAGGTAEVARLSRLAIDQTASVSEFFAGHSHEKAIDIVECLLTGRSRIFHVITANHGSINNLPWDAPVEIPANIGSDRVQGLNMGSLPIGLRNFVRRNLDQDELFMEATVQKDLRLLFQAWLGDHYTYSMLQARAYWDEWLAGHPEDIAGWTDFDSRNAQ